MNNDTIPNACRTNCRLPSCGDCVQDDGEACDTEDSSVCRNCQIPICGDGIVDPWCGEECDDGNFLPGDGCTPTCRLECGNGIKDGNEECDDGMHNSDNKPDACRTNCVKSVCGDGITDGMEECDDGALNSNTNPNACRENCRIPFCGDGVHDDSFNEHCDDGVHRNLDYVADGCTSRCTFAKCSQSLTDVVIDFANLLPDKLGYYTYMGSQTSPPCHEGVRWFVYEQFITASKEQLHALTSIHDNTARPTQPINLRLITYPTTYTSVCGNGIREGDEQCDDPHGNSDELPNRCRTNCRLPHCGDGVTDCAEECDGGMTCNDKCFRGLDVRGNKTIVNVFFRDLIPFNHFCCGAEKPDPRTRPCSNC